jgi:hypothetical protein
MLLGLKAIVTAGENARKPGLDAVDDLPERRPTRNGLCGHVDRNAEAIRVNRDGGALRAGQHPRRCTEGQCKSRGVSISMSLSRVLDLRERKEPSPGAEDPAGTER